MKDDKTCDICFKIICRKCKWEASDEEIKQIQSKELTECPVCGWSPSDAIIPSNTL